MVQLWRSFSWLIPVVAVVGVVVLLMVGFASWARTEYQMSAAAARRAVLDGLVGVWVVAVAAITLVPGSAVAIPGEGPAVELVPFRDLAMQLTSSVHWEVPAVQIGGNLVLFASGGVLLALRSGHGWRRSAVTFLVIGLGVETAQLVVAGRSAVVDDVILAVIGGTTGAALGRWLRGRAAPASLTGEVRRPELRAREAGASHRST